jgi:anion-transporting  ArsA/GET3 family ATPase
MVNWLRARLRQWLGVYRNFEQICKNVEDINILKARITSLQDIYAEQEKCMKLLEERNRLAWERIVAIEQQHSEISSKQNELRAILAEVRQLRELLTDPKRTPVVAKTTHQFRALMEQEI